MRCVSSNSWVTAAKKESGKVPVREVRVRENWNESTSREYSIRPSYLFTRISRKLLNRNYLIKYATLRLIVPHIHMVGVHARTHAYVCGAYYSFIYVWPCIFSHVAASVLSFKEGSTPNGVPRTPANGEWKMQQLCRRRHTTPRHRHRASYRDGFNFGVRDFPTKNYCRSNKSIRFSFH